MRTWIRHRFDSPSVLSPLTIISEDTEFVIWKEKYTAGDFVKLRNHLLLSLGGVVKRSMAFREIWRVEKVLTRWHGQRDRNRREQLNGMQEISWRVGRSQFPKDQEKIWLNSRSNGKPRWGGVFVCFLFILFFVFLRKNSMDLSKTNLPTGLVWIEMRRDLNQDADLQEYRL